MRFDYWATLLGCGAAIALLGCAGHSGTNSTLDDASTDGDGSTDGDLGSDAKEGGEAAGDGSIACTPAQAAGACCCRGDELQELSCSAVGGVGCTNNYGLYFGDDCTRSCGPCSLPCVDAGTAMNDANDGSARDDGEVGADAGIIACMPAQTPGACCCRADEGEAVSCSADGGLSCTNNYGLYFGDDCWRSCGPCSIECDGGAHDADLADGRD